MAVANKTTAGLGLPHDHRQPGGQGQDSDRALFGPPTLLKTMDFGLEDKWVTTRPFTSRLASQDDRRPAPCGEAESQLSR